MKNYIIYHDSCLDGFISCMIAFYRAMYLKVENVVVIPSNYSDKTVETEDAASITLVDFSYPMDVLMNYVYKGIDVTVVDHHKTFIESFLKHDEAMQDQTLLVTYPEREASHYMKYHPVSGRPLFRDMTFVTDTSGKQTSFQLYLNNNEVENKNNKYVHSGASLCFQVATEGDELLRAAMIEATNGDIIETVRLARIHDLWLHLGGEMTDAYALSHWFKKFHKDNKKLIDSLKTNQTESVNIFRQLLAKFNAVPLATKIEEARDELKTLDKKLLILALSNSIKPVQLKLDHPDGVKICYVDHPDVRKLGISIVGSYMTRKAGWDVAIMDAVVEDDRHIYSLRSNEQGSNVNVAAICEAYMTADLAMTGGGHRNAAGVAFAKDMKDSFFTVLEEEEPKVVVEFEITKELHDSITMLAALKNKTFDECAVEFLDDAAYKGLLYAKDTA